MEMSLREWLVLIGIIIIAGVLADGYRRMRLARKRSSELSFELEDVEGGEGYGSELPNGGARKIHTTDDAGYLRQEPAVDRQPLETVRNWGRQEEPGHLPVKDRIEPDISDPGEPSAYDGQRIDGREPYYDQATADDVPVLTPIDNSDIQPEPVARTEETIRAATADREPTKAMVQQELAMDTAEAAPPRPKKTAGRATEKLSDRSEISEILVVNLLSKGEPFEGARLMHCLLSSGMKYGDRSIFHRYARKDGTGRILFSLANGVEPGVFDISRMEETETPVVSLFLALPGPKEPLKAFALMEEMARQLALDLGAELKDENMSVLTQQTLEHYRQRIREFERRQLALKMSD